jgi:SHS family sialic acid transporter-like MFS transporter
MAVDDPTLKAAVSSSVPGQGALSGRGRWAALAAALLGWLFDGLEMGLFPQVARPALRDLLTTPTEEEVVRWFAVINSGFLVGAATGGVLFGWLGDRLGRVRAMTLSVIAYAVFSGLCGLASSVWQVALLRFVAALGMGGEWSLGVALIMEIWPNRSRGVLAGLIGAAANFGYLLVAVVGLCLDRLLGSLRTGLLEVGVAGSRVDWLTASGGWRILLLLGTTPALLAFFIRLMVPESSRWEEERARGSTTHWAVKDLVGVGFGAAATWCIIALWAGDQFWPTFGVFVHIAKMHRIIAVWAGDLFWPLQVVATLAALIGVTAGYLFPTLRYLQRSDPVGTADGILRSPTLWRMLLAACLSAVPLMATWGSVQFAPTWADQLANPKGPKGSVPPFPEAKYYTQLCTAGGACVGALFGSLLGGWIGRRLAYTILCLSSLAATLIFFQVNHRVDALFLTTAFLAGGLSASFYGWLPLYLPELFRTGMRATGQGFGFNFGRVLAAIGVLQLGTLIAAFDGSYPRAASVLCCVYILGLGLIWLAPETRGRPLPE